MKAENYLKRRGFGAVAPLPASVVNYQVPIPQTPTNTGGGFLNTLSNIFSKGTAIAQKIAPVVSNVQSTINTLKNNNVPNNTVPMTLNPNTGQYEQTTGMSTTQKVLIGAGVLVAAGGLAYALKGKKKK